jgi:hypothetical protein
MRRSASPARRRKKEEERGGGGKVKKETVWAASAKKDREQLKKKRAAKENKVRVLRVLRVLHVLVHIETGISFAEQNMMMILETPPPNKLAIERMCEMHLLVYHGWNAYLSTCLCIPWLECVLEYVSLSINVAIRRYPLTHNEPLTELSFRRGGSGRSLRSRCNPSRTKNSTSRYEGGKGGRDGLRGEGVADEDNRRESEQ